MATSWGFKSPLPHQFPGEPGGLRAWTRLLRPHQWVKNFLVFAPLAAAHETQAEPWLMVAGLFAALTACASGTYVLNDLLDLPYDRGHAVKCRRPLAAGTVAMAPAIGLGAALTAGGLAAAFGLSAAAGRWVLLYVVLTAAYSLAIKRRLLLDIITLAALFAVRVLVGGAAAAVPLSPWFVAFSIFFFLALAIAKRQCELQRLHAADLTAVGGRAWRVEDLAVLAALGAASGFAAVLVVALYISSPAVSALYTRPDFLWVLCPLLLYWTGRATLLANRGAIDDDPVLFVLRDRTSWLTGAAALAVLSAAL